MASINGLSLKKVKTFRGHEGEPCFQGDLYLGKTKIGFWSQDSWGAIMDNIDMEPGYSEQLLRNQICALNKDKEIHGVSMSGGPYTIEYDIEQLMTAYLDLADNEKSFKSAVKNGYAGTLVLSDSFHVLTWKLPKEYTELDDESLKKATSSHIRKAEEKMFKNEEKTIKIYRSLDDFNIGTAIKLEDIKRK